MWFEAVQGSAELAAFCGTRWTAVSRGLIQFFMAIPNSYQKDFAYCLFVKLSVCS